jgi:hypothetical protein
MLITSKMSPTYLQQRNARPTRQVVVRAERAQATTPRKATKSELAAGELVPSQRLASAASEAVAARTRPSLRQQRILISKRLFGWLVLMPLCIITLNAFLRYFLPAVINGSLFGSSSMRWFIIGIMSWSMLHTMLHRKLSVLYVFGHEWTHALAAHLCRAKVYRVKVGLSSGYVETSKSNVFISLSPYVVPFYTVLFMALYSIASFAFDLPSVHRIPIGKFSLPFNHELLFYFGVGFTWSFHLLYTLRTLNTTQSDLTRNGESFSLFVILTTNLYLLAGLLLLSSPSLGWEGAWSMLNYSFAQTWHYLKLIAAELSKALLSVTR